MNFRFALIAFALFALAGCKTKSISYYDTEDIAAEMTAVADGSGTRIDVQLKDPQDSLAFMQLTADDQLTAWTGTDAPRALSEDSALGVVNYHAEFNQTAGGTVFHVKLARLHDAGAPDSYAALPEPFTLQGLSKTTYSRKEPVIIAWAPATADPMKIEITGTCLESYSASISSTATFFEVPANALRQHTAGSTSSSPAQLNCEAHVEVRRSAVGHLDPAFRSGEFEAHQVRKTTFSSVP